VNDACPPLLLSNWITIGFCMVGLGVGVNVGVGVRVGVVVGLGLGVGVVIVGIGEGVGNGRFVALVSEKLQILFPFVESTQ